MRASLITTSFLLVTLFIGCKESKEDFEREAPSDYIPLQTGKYFTYRLDSLVFPQAGRAEETHYYQEKHVIDAQITDNLGRPSYRVFRYLRDTAATQAWQPAGSYFVTSLAGSVEVIDDNMRIVKLASPIAEGTTWKGNRFLADEPYATKYSFSNDDNMEDWDYNIESKGESIKLGNKTFNNVITVRSIDEALNAPVTAPLSFGSKSFSEERYAKGIGMIQQELTLWEYQPNTGSTAYKLGFGVKRRLIDHN
jgi:hypothetical protein